MSIIAAPALLQRKAFGSAAAVASLRFGLQAGLVCQSAYERRGSGLDREPVERKPMLAWGAHSHSR